MMKDDSGYLPTGENQLTNKRSVTSNSLYYLKTNLLEVSPLEFVLLFLFTYIKLLFSTLVGQLNLMLIIAPHPSHTNH